MAQLPGGTQVLNGQIIISSVPDRYVDMALAYNDVAGRIENHPQDHVGIAARFTVLAKALDDLSFQLPRGPERTSINRMYNDVILKRESYRSAA